MLPPSTRFSRRRCRLWTTKGGGRPAAATLRGQTAYADLPEGPFSAEQARLHGRRPAALRRDVADGSVTRLRRVVYLETQAWRTASTRERHLFAVLAAARTMRDPVFSHRSAAALFGIPLLEPWPDEVHVASAWPGGGRARPGVVAHGTTSPPTTVQVKGVRVASAARTVVDLARTETFASALMAADAVLHAGAATPAELTAELAAAGRGRGVRAAATVLAAASPLAESPGESLSRARMIERGLPLPVCCSTR